MMPGTPRYSTRVLDLFRRLPGATALPGGEGTQVVGEALALDRSTWIRFEARIAGGRVADCVFKAWGCPHTLAAAAWVVQGVRSHPVAGHTSIDAARLVRELEVPVEKMGRMLVVEDALEALLKHARAVQ
jgi:NifU-like protein involved in Fe-S cluster formation